MFQCEICGKSADKHHIVHRCEGGIDHPINIKYLCPDHHRGPKGPHKCKEIDIEYKLELQNKLEGIFQKEYYTAEKLCIILDMKPKTLKRILNKFKLYKEGYKREDIIYALMGNKQYDELMLENFEDIIPIYNLA